MTCKSFAENLLACLFSWPVPSFKVYAVLAERPAEQVFLIRDSTMVPSMEGTFRRKVISSVITRSWSRIKSS